MKSEKQYSLEYVDRLSFDDCMLHNDWIVKQFENIVELL